MLTRLTLRRMSHSMHMWNMTKVSLFSLDTGMGLKCGDAQQIALIPSATFSAAQSPSRFKHLPYLFQSFHQGSHLGTPTLQHHRTPSSVLAAVLTFPSLFLSHQQQPDRTAWYTPIFSLHRNPPIRRLSGTYRHRHLPKQLKSRHQIIKKRLTSLLI